MATTRRRLTGYLAAAAAIAAAASATVVSSPVQAQTRSSSTQVRVATYNTSAGISHERAVSDVVALAGRADIIGLQEMSSLKRRNAVKQQLIECDTCRFQGHMPREAVPGGTPILFRSDKFRFKDAGTKQVSEDTYVGPKGAGPSTLRAKYINWVKLRERLTGRIVYVLNNHAVPTVEGRGGLPNWAMEERLELYRQHMRGLTRLIQELRENGGLVFVTGDLNVNFRTDQRARHPLFPYSRLGRVGLKASYAYLGEPDTGTHRLQSGNDSRLIDYVYTPASRKLRATSQRILGGYSSDHRPVLVAYTMR